MDENRPPVAGVDDIDMPTTRERRTLGRTRPTRRREIMTGTLAIMVGLCAAIFEPQVRAMMPLPLTAYVLLTLAVAAAAADVARCSWLGRPVRVAPLMIVSVAGGVMSAAVAIDALL